MIQLHGQADDYTLSGPSTHDGKSGYGLRYRGELIALIDGSATRLAELHTNLQDPGVSFL